MRRCEHREPGVVDEVRQARLRERRHVGQLRHARFPRYRERAQLPGPDQVAAHVEEREAHGRVAAQHAGIGFGQAAVRDHHEVRLGDLLEEFRGNPRGAADACRGVGERARLGLGRFDERAERAIGTVPRRDQDAGRCGHLGDGYEIGHRIEGQVLVDGPEHHVPVGGEEEGQAIGRRPRDAAGAGQAAAVLHDDGLAPDRLQFLRQRAHEDVRHAARGERHDDLDRLVGKRGRVRDRRGQSECCCAGAGQHGAPSGCLHHRLLPGRAARGWPRLPLAPAQPGTRTTRSCEDPITSR